MNEVRVRTGKKLFGPSNTFLDRSRVSAKAYMYCTVHCTVIPVDTLLLVGNMDPEVTLEMVSQSAEFVTRYSIEGLRDPIS